MKICAATGNAGKLRELRRILEAQGHEVVSQKELGITIEPDETGTTFEENALIKAETICKASGLPTIADDSGLCVDALEGAPATAAATATMRPTTTSCWRICRMSRRNSAVQNLWPLSALSCPPAGT